MVYLLICCHVLKKAVPYCISLISACKNRHFSGELTGRVDNLPILLTTCKSTILDILP
jgi:hypothetical protein